MGGTAIQSQGSVYYAWALSTEPHGHPRDPSPNGDPYLLASWMPLSVVEPSRLTNSRRLLSVGTQGRTEAEWSRGIWGGPGAGSTVPQASLRGQLTLGVAAVREVLALHDLLHNVICVNPSVIYPGRVALHRVLLPPGVGQSRVTAVWLATGTKTTMVSPYRAQAALRVRENLFPVMLLEPSPQPPGQGPRPGFVDEDSEALTG